MQTTFPPVRKREIFSWCCFDFANSSFTTIIITVVYSVYFTSVVASGNPAAKAWWGIMLALSQIVVILLSPWLGAVADFQARKKCFLMWSAILCSLFTALLFWTGEGTILFALIFVALANIAFSFSENFCSSFLPEISTPPTCGRISGYGWSFGYMGGLASLGIVLWMLSSENGSACILWTFPMTGAFFILASLPTLIFLRERAVPQTLPNGISYWRYGWTEIFRTLKQLPQHRTLAIFFLSFTCFMSGLFAVISFASIFAGEVLHFSQKETILLFITLQISSAIGAFGFGFLQDKVGSKNTLIFALVIWIVVSLWAFFCQTKTEFFIIGNLAGLGIGSLQSASRAVVSMLVPPKQSGEFFGFWGLFGKLGAIIGPASAGFLSAWIGLRYFTLLNLVFFLLGFIILLSVKLPRYACSN
ncbi:MAG: MFS transporter [Verrucomicrobiota bacterium]